WYSRAITAIEEALRRVNRNAYAQGVLRDTHWGRAQALDQLKRYAEAAQDWNRAVELSPEPERDSYRINRALSLVRIGKVAESIEAAEVSLKNANANLLYNATCVFALAAGDPDESTGGLSREECAKRAVALLQQAVAKGYKDAEHMKKDDDLKALRG